MDYFYSSCFPLLDSFSAVPKRRVLFSCFAVPESFSAAPRASGPIFRFCAHELVFSGTESDGSRFHILRSRTRFRRYRDRRVPFSCLAHPDKFSAVPRASGPVFMFHAPEHIFGGIVGVKSLFHVLRCRTHFRRYRGHRVPFSCFTLPYSFLAVRTTLRLAFMFCSLEYLFGGTEGVRSSFHVLRCGTHFSQYRGRRVPF
jgi:hypothetical protein